MGITYFDFELGLELIFFWVLAYRERVESDFRWLGLFGLLLFILFSF